MKKQKKSVFGKFINTIVAALVVLAMSAIKAQAAIDTTNMDAVAADATSWVAYGVTTAVGIFVAGLAYVGARWVYKKIKAGVSAS